MAEGIWSWQREKQNSALDCAFEKNSQVFEGMIEKNDIVLSENCAGNECVNGSKHFQPVRQGVVAVGVTR